MHIICANIYIYIYTHTHDIYAIYQTDMHITNIFKFMSLIKYIYHVLIINICNEITNIQQYEIHTYIYIYI
jgi:hypothetical protein